ncbi:hypothetical protein [Streptomyces sp. NPDC049879]|uniref:hypothetical protein n=1 Tax=Streptomyces sp. NPDC049879 TaxID=3365598 RepID=UPI0037B9CB45
MAAYRIAYAGQAHTARAELPDKRRARLDKEMSRTLGRDPYKHGSTPVEPHDKDRRDATVDGMFVTYYVSRDVLTVTAVRLVRL